MGYFDLSKYETVEQKIARFYADHPDGRIITTDLTTDQDRQVSTWRVKAEVFVPIWDTAYPVSGEVRHALQQSFVLKATGHAFEIDGGKSANATSALENAESSAVGRALRMAGYLNVSREEMAKVNAGITPKTIELQPDWLDQANKFFNDGDIVGMRSLYARAKTAGVDADILETIATSAELLKKQGETK